MSVFDQAWGVVKIKPEESRNDPYRNPGPNPFDPTGQVMNPFFDKVMGIKDEPEVEAPIDMGGDACCIDAKNKWEEACIEGFPDDWDAMNYPYATEGEVYENEIEHNLDGSPMHRLAGGYYQSILDKYRNMSCDEFREHLESRLGDISMGSLEGQLAMAAHKILEEWDKCVQESTLSDDQVDMFLSDRQDHNPFDSAWDVAKQDMQTILADFDKNKRKLARLSVDDGVFNTVEGYSGVSYNPDIKAGWSQGFRERGHNVQTIELERTKPTKKFPKGKHIPGMFGYNPDFNDIMDVHAEDLIEGANGEPIHVFTASYPCEDFSLLGGGKKWTDWDKEKKRKFNIARALGDADFFKDPRVGPTPVEELQGPGLDLLRHTLQVRDDLRRDNPDMLWLLENPNNSLSRYQPELGMEPLIQPRPIGMSSKYPPFPEIEGVNRVRIKRKPHEAPPPSVTHASYASRLGRILGGSGEPMPGSVLEEKIPGLTTGLPPRKPTDLWSNLAHGLGGFEARPITTPGVHPNFPQEIYEKPTRYYPDGSRGVPGKGRVWPPKRFGHAGIFHEVGERGGGGIHRQGQVKLPSGLKIPPYWMRSLIPADLGRDVADAAEKWYGLR